MYLQPHSSSASVLSLRVYIMLACCCMSILGKSNKTALLACHCRFVLKAYNSTIVLRNGNWMFILVSIVQHK